MMRLAIRHVTEYSLEERAHFVLQETRMRPQAHAGQQVLEWRVELEGGSLEASFDDHHGNRVMLFSLFGAERARLVCEGIVEVSDRAGVVGPHRGFAPLWLYQRETALTAAGAGVRAIIADMPRDGEDTLATLHRLNAAVSSAVRYTIGQTEVETTAEAALAAGVGVCQDQAHVFCAAARALGFPARYVSGYLMMTDRALQDASHAWAEAHIDGLGWVGFDPANRQSPDARYVRVAHGLDYAEAAPVRGLRRGSGGEALVVSVEVQQQ